MGEVLVTVIVEEASLSNPGVIGSKIQEKRETKKKITKKKNKNNAVLVTVTRLLRRQWPTRLMTDVFPVVCGVIHSKHLANYNIKLCLFMPALCWKPDGFSSCLYTRRGA